MSDFQNREIEQQKQPWLDIAELALRRWRIKPRSIRRLGHGANVVFRVTTSDGDTVLRLHQAGSVNAARLRSELHWLAAIRHNTKLLAPFPAAARLQRGAQPFLVLRHDLLPPPSTVYAVLFEYIEGEVKPACDLSARDLTRVGEYLGTLHSDGQFEAGADFDRPRLDWEGLFGACSPYASPEERLWAGAEQRAIMNELAEQLKAPLSELACRPAAMGLIHADLLAKNIVFRADAIAALDFEYCGWGFYLYDLAPLLWQLRGERAGDYDALEDALWRGYRSLRPVADADRELLESFIAARQLASIRWLLANKRNPTLREIAPALIAERCEELKVFLETGILRRATPTL